MLFYFIKTLFSQDLLYKPLAIAFLFLFLFLIKVG